MKYISILGGLLCSIAGLTMAETDLSRLAEKESLNLVVTDSGLGGLSVVADIARRAEESNQYREVNIVFVNALFRQGAGYNSLPTRDAKIEIFNNSLESILQRYDPDAILIACNTLSVLLPDCTVAQSSDTPVVGIVEAGVDLIADELKAKPEATAILFATETTRDEGSHRDGLLAQGISDDRIVVQACPGLTWYIEQDPLGFDTELLISTFVSDALEARKDKAGPVALSFNCTHYGYSQSLWEQEFRNAGVELTSTLNPNTVMADPLFPADLKGRYDSANISIKVISMIEIKDQVVGALGPVLAETSPQTAEALSGWEQVPELFEWESVVQNTEKATKESAEQSTTP